MPDMKNPRAWYATSRAWRRRSKLQLSLEPLCRYCQERGIIQLAEVSDHITPHGGSWNEFRLGALQSLCRECHNRTKQREERDGYRCDIDSDGWPTDPKHPANRAR